MNKILVTGANGCIGNVLVSFLVNSGYRVTALALDDNNTDKIQKIEEVKIVFGDICDKGKMGEVFLSSIFHIVIHLAGIVHNPDATLEECMEVNCKATSNLYDFSKKYGVKQFIFVSSVAIYGEDVENVLDEASPVDPQTPYAVSKFKAEEYIKNNHENTIKYTIIRPTTVYGKYDRGNINRLFSIAKRGFIPIIGNGNNRKSFVYVENLVEGILKAISNEKAYNQTFILSDIESYTLNQIIKTMENIINKRVVTIRFPIRVVIFMLRLLNRLMKIFGMKDLFNVSSIKKLVTNNVFDISRANKILNYKPRYNLAEGLKRTYLSN